METAIAAADEPGDETIEEWYRKRTIVLTYDPATDKVDVDAGGCSPLEVRGIVEMASEVPECDLWPEMCDCEDDDE